MLQSMESQRVGHDFETEQKQFNLRPYWLEAIKVSRTAHGHTTLNSLILSQKLSRAGPG